MSSGDNNKMSTPRICRSLDENSRLKHCPGCLFISVFVPHGEKRPAVGTQIPKGTEVQPIKCSRPQCGLVGIACSHCGDGAARSFQSRAKLSTKGKIDKAKCHLCKGKHKQGADFRAERCLRGAKELAAPLLSAVASTFASSNGLVLSDSLVVSKYAALFPRLLESCPTVVTLAALILEAIVLTPGYSLRAEWLSDTGREGCRSVVSRLSEVFLRFKDEEQKFQPALKVVLDALWLLCTKGIHWELSPLTKDWTGEKRGTVLDMPALVKKAAKAGPKEPNEGEAAAAPSGVLVWLRDCLELQSRVQALEKRFEPLTADTVRCAPVVALNRDSDGPTSSTTDAKNAPSSSSSSSSTPAPPVAIAAAPPASPLPTLPTLSPLPARTPEGNKSSAANESSALEGQAAKAGSAKDASIDTPTTKDDAAADKQQTKQQQKQSDKNYEEEQVKAFGKATIPTLTAGEAINTAFDLGDGLDVAVGAVGLAAAAGFGGAASSSVTAAGSFMVHSYTVAQTSMSVADNITLSAVLAGTDGLAKLTGSALFASSLGSLGLLYVGLSPVVTSLKALDWVLPRDDAGAAAMAGAYAGAGIGVAGSAAAVGGAALAVGAQGTLLATSIDALALIGAAAGGSTAAGLSMVAAAPAALALATAAGAYGGIALGKAIAKRTPSVSTYRDTRDEEINLYFNLVATRLFDGMIKAVEAERAAFKRAKDGGVTAAAAALEEVKTKLKVAAQARIELYPPSEDIDEEESEDEEEGEAEGEKGAAAAGTGAGAGAGAGALAVAGATGIDDDPRPKSKAVKRHYALLSFSQCCSGIKLCSGCNRSSCFTETQASTRTSRPVLRCNRLDCLRLVTPCRMCVVAMSLNPNEWCTLCQSPSDANLGRSAAMSTRSCAGMNRPVALTVVFLKPGQTSADAIALAADARAKAAFSPGKVECEQLVVTQEPDDTDAAEDPQGGPEGASNSNSGWQLFDALGKEIVSSVKRVGRPKRARKALTGKMTAHDKALLKEQVKQEKKEKDEKAKQQKEKEERASSVVYQNPLPSARASIVPGATGTAGAPPASSSPGAASAASSASLTSSALSQIGSFFWGKKPANGGVAAAGSGSGVSSPLIGSPATVDAGVVVETKEKTDTEDAKKEGEGKEEEAPPLLPPRRPTESNITPGGGANNSAEH